jgi:membrane protein implicated in regulation of membrane protease activity
MGILEFILVVLVILWLGGAALHIGGGLIHILIILALLGLVYRIWKGRGV